jgi:membrane protease YdiL (CAAX protease family)
VFALMHRSTKTLRTETPMDTLPAAAAASEFGPSPSPDRGTLLFGRFGLRAGWSMALFVVLFLVLTMVLGVVQLAATDTGKQPVAEREAQSAGHPAPAAKPAPAGDLTPRGIVAGETVALAATVLATLLLAGIERRRMAVYGIDRSTLLNILPGALWGLVSLSLLVLALRSCHALVFDSIALRGPAVYLYGAKWLLGFLLVGLLEEYRTRGFLQFTLTRGLIGLGERTTPGRARFTAFWSGAVIMSVVFAALHLGNPGETPAGILMVFCAGLLLSYALWRTGSLWWAIGFHTTWDWAQSFLYGVPDSGTLSTGRLFQTHATGPALLSGGADGPEGSLLVLPTLLLVALLIRYTTRPGVQPPLEAEMRD